MIKIAALIFTTVLLTACSSTSENATNENETHVVAKNKDMVCEQRASTGSHLRKKRCMSRKVAEAVREVNKENMRALNKAQALGEKNKM